MLEIMRVLIHMPDVWDVLLLQISVEALADPDQPIFDATG